MVRKIRNQNSGRPSGSMSTLLPNRFSASNSTLEAFVDLVELVSGNLQNLAYKKSVERSMSSPQFVERLNNARSKLKPGEGLLIITSFHQWKGEGGYMKNPTVHVGPAAKSPELAIVWWRNQPGLWASPANKGWERKETYIWDTLANGPRDLIVTTDFGNRCFISQQ